MQIRGTFMQSYAEDIDKGIDIYFLRNHFVFIIILRQM